MGVVMNSKSTQIWTTLRHLTLVCVVVVGVLSILATGGRSGGGGGGPSSVPTDTNLPFSIFSSGFFTSGHTETYQLSGSDTAGGTHIATVSRATQAQTTFNSQPAIPVLVLITITNTTTGAFISATGTDFYSTGSTSRMLLGFTSSTTTFLPVTINVIPQSATIGDFGVVGSYIGGGETHQITWQLTNANNGLANLVVNSTITIAGILDVSEEDTFVIDQQGNPSSLTVKIFLASIGVTITVSGNRQ